MKSAAVVTLRAAALSLAALVGGCNPDAPMPAYLGVAPAMSSLAGTYVPDTAEAASLGSARAFPASIALRADGTLSVTGVPQSWRTRAMDPALSNASGKWELGRHDQQWAIMFEFAMADELSVDIEKSDVEVFVLRDAPPHKLLIRSQTKPGEEIVFSLSK
jgi:hypothetical protein